MSLAEKTVLPNEGPLFLACSPRRDGNSDAALSILRENLGGPSPLFLRDYVVLPCISCGHCSRFKGECHLLERDDSAFLFGAMQAASSLILAAPVYFYHVPAQLKTFMDRSQPWWMLRERWSETPPRRKEAHVVLVASRSKGERLFEGALLSLRYWLDLFGFDLAGTLSMRGLEGPDELREKAEQRALVSRFAEDLKQRSGTVFSSSGTTRV